MTKYIVTGGRPLRGEVTLHGAKNAGFKAMIAALLCNAPSTICNLGFVSEVEFARQAIESLGGSAILDLGKHCLTVNPHDLKNWEIPKELGQLSRASNMYAPPLLARFGKAVLPIPGGDQIGRRPLERHMEGLQAMGVKIDIGNNVINLEAPRGIYGVNYRFTKNTHTGTELLVMMAVTARGKTVLENAAAEPEIDNLIEFLNKAGAKITRTEQRKIVIEGVTNLRGVTHTVIPDRNAAVTFACAALATRGDVFIRGAQESTLRVFLDKVIEVGGNWGKEKDGIRFNHRGPIKATDITTGPYPAFMTDWQPLWATLMTQACGVSVVHETVYEKRFDYVPGLVKMGAKIEFFQPKMADPDVVYNFNLTDDVANNPHAIRIYGPTVLHGREIEVNDVRSGATALMAGLAAQGETTILDAQDQIKRGYENLDGNLRKLGAEIETVTA